MARPATTRTCRLTLTIAGADYRLRRVVGGWRLRKVGTGEVYLVRRTDDGAECSCYDFMYRSYACKHIRSLRALGLVR
jgi:SWIM zinc finger